jgi:hypothetical protein
MFSVLGYVIRDTGATMHRVHSFTLASRLSISSVFVLGCAHENEGTFNKYL